VGLLRAPESGNDLRLEVLDEKDGEVLEGRLFDDRSGEWFRIEGGIADLSPLKLRRADRHEAFCKRHGLDVGPATQAQPVSPVYSEQIRFFKDYHEQYEVDVVESPFYRVLDRVTLGAWMQRALRPGARVADIGCGSGRQAVPLVGRGCDVIGLDLSEEMLRLARGKLATVHGLGSADFVVASAEALPLRSAAVDASVIYGSLHHFADAEAAVREAARVIEPGGQFYMLEPHDSALRPVFEWSMKRWTLWEEEAADEPLFNAQQWEGWLGRCGIQPKIRYSTYLPPHLFYVLKGKVGEAVLSGTDRLFGSLPGVRRLAGVIIAEGAKRG
jgi:SAM-dependent methyltransferase/uncharacterized protein YbaR (Trm112 family)